MTTPTIKKKKEKQTHRNRQCRQNSYYEVLGNINERDKKLTSNHINKNTGEDITQPK